MGRAPRERRVPTPPGWSSPRVVRGRRARCEGDLMTSRFEVHTTGRLAQTVSEAINTRFGAVAVTTQLNSTVLTGSLADQAALRALLALIWDTGGTVLSVTLDPDPDSSAT